MIAFYGSMYLHRAINFGRPQCSDDRLSSVVVDSKALKASLAKHLKTSRKIKYSEPRWYGTKAAAHHETRLEY